MNKKHIYNSVRDFFLCTYIPLKAFSYDGTLIVSEGYNSDFENLFINNDVYNFFKSKFQEQQNTSLMSTTYSNNISFTAFNICLKNFGRGIIIMGPYALNNINISNGLNIAYKPAACIPHLISMFHCMIQENNFDASYSFHVKKAIDYMNAKYNEPITLSTISHTLSINKCYFSSIFKKETGKSFSQFLNEVRVEKSKSLLLNENLSILDVSLSVGFNNQTYYNTVFKGITNMTPLEYRCKAS